MKLFKYLFIPLYFLSFGVYAQDISKEFKIELIIFKYSKINSIESFEAELRMPNEDLIYFYDENSSIKKMNHSNFSNMSDYFSNIIDDNKKQNKKNYPLIWFRDDDQLDLLKDLEIKISNDKELELIDSKSWLQTLPSFDSSKYLFYESKNKNFGFLLNFYQKRFMHIDLKAYLGNSNPRSKKINLFINDDRRIFNNEVHFFDHPHFGLVISVKEI
tara:strand:+ start:3358 stop:4005 length:648 start_codon:yes stop_codon:yes gene_type:complete